MSERAEGQRKTNGPLVVDDRNHSAPFMVKIHECPGVLINIKHLKCERVVG